MMLVISYRNYAGEDHEDHKAFMRRTARLTPQEARHYLALEDDDQSEGFLFLRPGDPVDHALLVTTYEWDARHSFKFEGGKEHNTAKFRLAYAEGLLSEPTFQRLLRLLESPFHA
jgi:hypothetical protein